MGKLGFWVLSLIFILALMIISGEVIFDKFYPYPSQIKYGVSFSPGYAKYLGLDWQKTYIQILDELKVKNLRIPTYWDVLQVKQTQLDFTQTDYLINEAGKRGAQVVLVVGARQPRWPECHIPAWAKSLGLAERHQKILDFIQKTIDRYKDNSAIWAWQVENEPFAFWFGENCDPPDEKFLQEEIRLVKALDSNRPVIVTDSGEWGSWVSAMKDADILGVSLYKKSYNPIFNGYITYPFPAWMYPLKSNLVRYLFVPSNRETIISELQTEPWFQKAVLATPLDQQATLFSISDFKGNIEYAKKTRFDQMYLWGVEWWYFMASQGYPEYLEYAKTLFR